MGHRPSELSGGEQQRVAIARALANDPKFLIMDEPTGNIDSRTAAEIVELIKRLNEENQATIILVTHDARMAARAKRTVEMLDGAIVQELAN
jgi:putative ABC transport system ATP-binding protein